jgi:flagellar basal-body rod protein FlgB
MGFGDIPLLNILQQKMTWLSDRQGVLSRNVANASTPGFVPMDLNEKDFAAAVSEATRGGLATTNARHLRGNSSAGGSFTLSPRRTRNPRPTETPSWSKSR